MFLDEIVMKKKIAIICVGLGLCLLLSGCAFTQTDDPVLTQLQIREIQTRELETSDMKLVMKSMMNVLQDEGYIIKNAVTDIGLLSAEKNIDIENTAIAILMVSLNSQAPGNARWKKQQILEASANLSEFGKKTRVRINFQIKTLDNVGHVQNVVTVKDPKHYQEFFDKVRKGVFIQEQGI